MRQIAEDVLKSRYYQPGETCWGDIAKRVSGFIATDGGSLLDYFNAINNLELIPNSPALMNAGTSNPQLSACFCIPIDDSIESIFDAVKCAAIIHKSGGGTGFNFSDIRAKGSAVEGTGHCASGPVSFMHVFNQATETIKQGGKRRGANLGALDVNHKDIKEFITCKTTEGDLENFNISVNITDEFMNLVKNESFDTIWIKSEDPEVPYLTVGELWNLIVDGNWRNGEPGMLFQDTAERDNKRSDLGKLKYRNPCSEATLLAWESCNLASINLMSCYNYEHEEGFNWDRFRYLVRLGVRFLNDMIDANRYPLPQIEEATKKTRKIGLGVMGFADLLISLGMRYGDDDSLHFADTLFKDMREVAEHESKLIGGNNAAVLSIAPTGCQKPDTMVMTSDGILKLSEIGDIRGDKWQQLDDLLVSQEYDWEDSTKFYINGEEKTKIITLYCGIELESTYNHQYRCLTEYGEYIWKCASDISVGDRIVSRIGGYSKTDDPELIPMYKTHGNSPDIELPKEMTSKLAEFVGILIGNGSFHERGMRLHFNNLHTEKHEYVIRLIKDVFGVDVKKYAERTCTSIYLSNMQIKRWLIANGLCKTSSKTAQIPELIRRSSYKSLKAFIDGLYFADGSHTGNTVYIDTSSKSMAQQLLVCFRALGINGRIHTYTDVKGRISKDTSYRVYFNQYGSVDFPHEKHRFVPLTMRGNHADAQKICESLYCEEVIDICDGISDTYDIEVPVGNCYVANGVISHNTISLFAGVSSGIEPNFGYVYDRSTMASGDKVKYREVHPMFDSYVRNSVPEYEKGIIFNDMFSKGTIRDCYCATDDIKDLFVTAKDISPRDHVRMQATIQRHIDQAISKTINCPAETTKEEISDLIRYAWESGCKGLTIYREGSRENVVLETNATKKVEETPQSALPSIAEGKRIRMKSACGILWVNVIFNGVKPVEVFVTTEGGGCNANVQYNSRMISKYLQKTDGDYETVCNQGDKVFCSACVKNKNGDAEGYSCANIIAEAIRTAVALKKSEVQQLERSSRLPHHKQISTNGQDICPDCGSPLIHTDGCKSCTCGFSRCK